MNVHILWITLWIMGLAIRMSFIGADVNLLIDNHGNGLAFYSPLPT